MKLDRKYFLRNSVVVAEDILGYFLICKSDEGKVVGKIIETEAYMGEDDLACHASRGRTKRTELLYHDAGHLYIYLNYGIFYMTNVVCGKINSPEAVLLRSVEIIEGIEIAKKRINRNKYVKLNHSFATGPGKLSIALDFNKNQNGLDIITSNEIYIEKPDNHRRPPIVKTSRIGVYYAKHCKNYPWRFYIKDNPFVSKK